MHDGQRSPCCCDSVVLQIKRLNWRHTNVLRLMGATARTAVPSTATRSKMRMQPLPQVFADSTHPVAGPHGVQADFKAGNEVLQLVKRLGQRFRIHWLAGALGSLHGQRALNVNLIVLLGRWRKHRLHGHLRIALESHGEKSCMHADSRVPERGAPRTSRISALVRARRRAAQSASDITSGDGCAAHRQAMTSRHAVTAAGLCTTVPGNRRDCLQPGRQRCACITKIKR